MHFRTSHILRLRIVTFKDLRRFFPHFFFFFCALECPAAEDPSRAAPLALAVIAKLQADVLYLAIVISFGILRRLNNTCLGRRGGGREK